MSAGQRDGLTRMVEAPWASDPWVDALRAAHARFLAIGGGLASLEARVSDLDRAHSERLMAVEERGIETRSKSLNELARRSAPKRPDNLDRLLSGAFKELDRFDLECKLRGFQARAEEIQGASPSWTGREKAVDRLLFDLTRALPL